MRTLFCFLFIHFLKHERRAFDIQSCNVRYRFIDGSTHMRRAKIPKIRFLKKKTQRRGKPNRGEAFRETISDGVIIEPFTRIYKKRLFRLLVEQKIMREKIHYEKNHGNQKYRTKNNHIFFCLLHNIRREQERERKKERKGMFDTMQFSSTKQILMCKE